MENKYYTPTIEEFRVGFIYEEASTMPYGLEFEEIIYGKDPNQDLALELINNLIKQKLVRVKYLDREDIESLGFTKESNSFDVDVYTSNLKVSHRDEPVSIIFNSMNNWVLIYCGEFAAILKQNKTEYHVNSTLFAGTIKNKSELIILLKQLGIQ